MAKRRPRRVFKSSNGRLYLIKNGKKYFLNSNKQSQNQIVNVILGDKKYHKRMKSTKRKTTGKKNKVTFSYPLFNTLKENTYGYAIPRANEDVLTLLRNGPKPVYVPVPMATPVAESVGEKLKANPDVEDKLPAAPNRAGELPPIVLREKKKEQVPVGEPVSVPIGTEWEKKEKPLPVEEVKVPKPIPLPPIEPGPLIPEPMPMPPLEPESPKPIVIPKPPKPIPPPIPEPSPYGKKEYPKDNEIRPATVPKSRITSERESYPKSLKDFTISPDRHLNDISDFSDMHPVPKVTDFTTPYSPYNPAMQNLNKLRNQHDLSKIKLGELNEGIDKLNNTQRELLKKREQNIFNEKMAKSKLADELSHYTPAVNKISKNSKLFDMIMMDPNFDEEAYKRANIIDGHKKAIESVIPAADKAIEAQKRLELQKYASDRFNAPSDFVTHEQKRNKEYNDAERILGFHADKAAKNINDELKRKKTPPHVIAARTGRNLPEDIRSQVADFLGHDVNPAAAERDLAEAGERFRLMHTRTQPHEAAEKAREREERRNFEKQDYENKLRERPAAQPINLGPAPVHIGSGKYANWKKGLYDDEIEKIMEKHDGDRFVPVIMSDQIPEIAKYVSPKTREFGFVINNQDSSKKGQHWMACYINKDRGSIDFYDPLVSNPTPRFMQDIKKVVDKMHPDFYFKFKTNMVKQQADNTDDCGFFCTKFLLDMFRGKPFRQASGFDDCHIGGQKMIEKFKKYI